MYRTGLHPTRHPITSADFKLPGRVDWMPVPDLPSFLPIVDRLLQDRVSVVGLRRSLGRSAWQDKPAHIAAGASFFGDDGELLRLERRLGRRGPKLAAVGAGFVLGPAFSTWWPESPYTSVAAMSKSAHAACELAKHLPTVPAIVWRHRGDLDRWAAWIASTHARAIAVDLGTLRQKHRWRWAMQHVEHLQQACATFGWSPLLVVSGPSRPDRMRDVVAAWKSPDIVFVSPQPYRLSIAGRILDDELIAHYAPELAVSDLLKINLAMFERSAADAIAVARKARPEASGVSGILDPIDVVTPISQNRTTGKIVPSHMKGEANAS
jgi:hypothetical protein